MAYSYVVYPSLTGSVTDFAVPFGYLDKEHVTVSVDGVNTSFTWLSASTVRVSPAPVGDLKITRATPKSTSVVTFIDGATHNAEDLNNQSLQSLYISQETDDAYTQLVDSVAEDVALIEDSTAVAVDAASDAESAAEVALGAASDALEVATQIGDLSTALSAAEADAQTALEAREGAELARSAAEVYRDAAGVFAANAQASSRTAATWSALSALTGADDGEGAEVLDTDTGTHLAASGTGYDGSSVSNAGRYTWSAAWSRWVRIGDTGLSGKADQTTIDARVPALTRQRSLATYPLVKTADGVPIWLEDGKLAAAGIADVLSDAIMAPRVSGAPAQLRGTARYPLIVTPDGVPVWLQGGKLAFAGISDEAVALIAAALNLDAPETVPSGVSSDGSTLSRYRAKAALRRTGVANSVIKVGLVGDSNMERLEIPQSLATMLYAAHGVRSSAGFMQINGASNLGGVSITRSGWTTYDASTNALPPRGCGPDGHAVYATGTAATLLAAGGTYTDLTILYWDGDGTFRYRIDGGSWVSVAGTGADIGAELVITGLSNTAHTLDIDLTGNAGTVEFHGLIMESPATSGVTVYKMGNGSATGLSYSVIDAYIAERSALLDLDLLIISLGANDSRASYASSTPETYADGLAALITAHRASNPTLSIVVLAMTPQHGETVGPGTYADYRNAGVARCEELGVEWYDARQDWDTYAVEYARGQWFSDNLHVNAVGASRLASDLFRKMLGA